jgi:hypothetical protein
VEVVLDLEKRTAFRFECRLMMEGRSWWMVYKCPRDGDYLMTRFQCGKCHFRNTKGRDPEHGNRSDGLFERCIRRATVDSFWLKEDATVGGS